MRSIISTRKQSKSAKSTSIPKPKYSTSIDSTKILLIKNFLDLCQTTQTQSNKILEISYCYLNNKSKVRRDHRPISVTKIDCFNEILGHYQKIITSFSNLVSNGNLEENSKSYFSSDFRC